MVTENLGGAVNSDPMISKEGVHAFNYGMALVRNVFERQQALNAGEPEKAKMYDSAIKGLSEKLRNDFRIDPDDFLYEVREALDKHWEGNK